MALALHGALAGVDSAELTDSARPCWNVKIYAGFQKNTYIQHHSASLLSSWPTMSYSISSEITETVSKARASSLFLPALRVVVEFQHGKSGRRYGIRIFPSMASCKRPTRCIGINPAGTSVTSVPVKLARCP